MDNGRLDLPSGSYAQRDQLCPGAFQACKGLPDEDSEAAAFGRAVDRAMSGDMTGLTDDQKETAEQALEIEAKILERWKEVTGIKEANLHRQLRLYDDPSKTDPTTSGQLDALWVKKPFGLLADTKSLFGAIPDATKNLQLRHYAVLAKLNFGLEKVTVFINQPKVTRNPVVVEYDRESLRQAEAEMNWRVARSMKPDGERIPGELQCKFCRAKGTPRCPESSQALLTFTQQRASYELLSPVEKSQLYDVCMQVEQLAKVYLGKIKEELKNGVQIPGLGLSKGKTLNPITDVQQFWERLHSKHSITVQEFVGLCGVGKEEAKAIVREKSGLKGKELDAEFAELCKGLTTPKECESSIKRT